MGKSKVRVSAFKSPTNLSGQEGIIPMLNICLSYYRFLIHFLLPLY